MSNDVAVLGIKVDPRGAVSGARRAKRAISGIGTTASRVKSAIFSLQGAIAGAGAASLVTSIVKTASAAESLKVRLKFLTGSTKDAERAFKDMNKFASKVPFTLEDIEQASPSLLTVAKDVSELNELLEITGDIAAVSGLSFKDTAMQLQRAFAGGIASADLFRERGVTAFLGFQQGVSYSAKETKKSIISMFRDGTTSAKGATAELAETFQGKVSMMEDSWRELKLQIADTGLFDEVSEAVIGITKLLKDPALKTSIDGTGAAIKDGFGYLVDNKDTILTVAAAVAGMRLGSAFGPKGAAIGALAAAIATAYGTGGETETEKASRRGPLFRPDLPFDTQAGEGEAFQGYKDVLVQDIKLVEDLKAVHVDLTEKIKQTTPVITEMGEEWGVALDMIDGQFKDLDREYAKLIAGIDDGTGEIKNSWKSMADSMRSSMEDAITESIVNFNKLGDVVSSVGNMVASMIIKRKIVSPLVTGLIGEEGGDGGLIGSLFSADGGGFTGGGARAGGVDGRGGFPAILHPDETVIDHTKGQQMSGQTANITFNVNAVDSQSFLARMSQNKAFIVGAVREAFNRNGRVMPA
mgnify:CR=1 FL=1